MSAMGCSSQGTPWRWTGTMARVRGPMAASTFAGSMPNVRGSTSTKTGTPPWWSTAIAVATKVKAGTMTSSPAWMPAPISARCSAEVPLLVARLYRAPTKAENSRSRARTSGASSPERTPRSSTPSTARRSSSPSTGQRTCAPAGTTGAPPWIASRCTLDRGANGGTSDLLHPLVEERVLLEQIVHRALAVPVVGRLEEERELALDATLTAALGHVHQTHQVDDQRGGEDRVLAEEVDLDLHPLAEEPEDVDVVPGFLLVTAGAVVVDVDLVVGDLVAEDLVEHRELAGDLGLVALRIVQHPAVVVAEDVGGEPALDLELPHVEGGGERGLEQGLPGLSVLAGDRDARALRQRLERRHLGQAGGEVHVPRAELAGQVEVLHGRADPLVVPGEPGLEGGDGAVDVGDLGVPFGRAEVDDDQPVQLVRRLEVLHVPGEELQLLAVPLGGDDVARVLGAEELLRNHSRPGLDGPQLRLDLAE